MNQKHKVITELFEICQANGNWLFNNDLVKEISLKHKFGNPFDVTKLDDTSKFPPILLENDYFVLHLGEGQHRFVKGINNSFHAFEPIESAQIFEWEYRKSILNEFDTSESNILSVANNQRIIHHFLYDDVNINSKVYLPRRTKTSLAYQIGETAIESTNLQMEIDLVMEHQGMVTVFEGKNQFPENFAVYQIYHPFLYYHNLGVNNHLVINMINCCYLLRKRIDGASVIRVYNYTFSDPLDMTSIKLVKLAQYNLVQK